MLEDLLPRMTGWDDVREGVPQQEARALPGARGRLVLQQGVRKPLVSLMGLVFLVLMIACSNLAGLLAARGRRGGANTASVWRSAPDAPAAAAVRRRVPRLLPRRRRARPPARVVGAERAPVRPPDRRRAAPGRGPDRSRVLGFGALVSVLAGVLFGVGPAYRAARLDPARTLRGRAGRHLSRTRGLRPRRLVTAQIALTLVLLVAAGLFAQSLRNLGRVDSA
jgi:hypothetical protein